MTRLGELDLPERLWPTVPRWATQIAFALLCVAAIEVVRTITNALAPGSSVFAIAFPAIMVATLFARWPSGMLTATLSITYTFFGIFLPTATHATVSPYLSVLAVSLAAALTVLLAETFRRSVRRATQERDRQIADRDLFLTEFDHRVKNNFTIVAGLLDMQRRRSADPATADALGEAIGRIDSIARAHRHLYRGGEPGKVEMRDYLDDLCTALAEALSLRGGLRLECQAEPGAIERDRAVSIGLVVNELVTNAAKHAFKDRAFGVITVRFAPRNGGWALTVADDGVGISGRPEPKPDGGLGSRLIEAFARQARGSIAIDSDRTGTIATLSLDA